MTAYYNILETIKNQLQVDEFVNTVTQGDIFDVDLNKQTIFPLSHIMVNNVTRESNVLRFNVTVMCMDIVDKSKTETTDIFLGNDNEQDVLNTQLAVVSRMLEIFDRGGNVNTFRMDGDPSIEPFTERFENFLAGWSCTFDILVANDMTVCGPLITPAGCAPATYIVQYVDGTPIESGTIPSGGSVTVSVPDVITCLDANYTLTDSDGNVLDSGTIPSGGSATIVAPDANISLNGVSFPSILSGGSDNIEVRQENTSTQVGSKQGQYWRIADSVITLQNTDGTTISTTNVDAENAATIVAPDSQLNVNSVDVGDVVSVKTIDVNLTDGTDPVTPDAVSLVGNTLTVAVPSGGTPPVGATLMKTGQIVSVRAGDDGDIQAGREDSFFLLDSTKDPNPFGNYQRFTGTTGGYYDQNLTGYYDKDGVSTTYSLAFPNAIMCDWSTYNGVNVLAYALDSYLVNNLQNILNTYATASYGGVTGWRLWNIREALNLAFWEYSESNMTDYFPLQDSLFISLSLYFTGNSVFSTTIRSINMSSISIGTSNSTQSRGGLAVRNFTVTGTTLT